MFSGARLTKRSLKTYWIENFFCPVSLNDGRRCCHGATVATTPLTITEIGRRAGALSVVEKLVLVCTCKQTPVSTGNDSSTRMPSVLDALFVRTALAVTNVHAFGTVREPDIVCKPFLKESFKETTGAT